MYKLKHLNSALLIGGVGLLPGVSRAQHNIEIKHKNVVLILVDDLKPAGFV